MAKWGKCDFKQLKEMQKRLDVLAKLSDARLWANIPNILEK